MWSSALFLFAIIGGLKFVYTYEGTRYKARLQEWERTLFDAAKWGGLIFVAIRILPVPLIEGTNNPWVLTVFTVARDWAHRWVPIPYLGTFVATYAIATYGARFLGWITRKSSGAEIQKAVREHGGELLQLLQRSYVEWLPILISTRTRKVYVGLVFASASLTREKFVVLLPLLSGYRDTDTLDVSFTMVYSGVLEDFAEELERRGQSGPGTARALEIEQLLQSRIGVLIPCSEIVSASPFDESIYLSAVAESDVASEVRSEHSH